MGDDESGAVFVVVTQGYVRRDDDFYFDYHKQSRSLKGFQEWLQNWVIGEGDHEGYLDLLGKERREKLTPGKELFSPPVNFSV